MEDDEVIVRWKDVKKVLESLIIPKYIERNRGIIVLTCLPN